jgi:hypothetical protein
VLVLSESRRIAAGRERRINRTDVPDDELPRLLGTEAFSSLREEPL